MQSWEKDLRKIDACGDDVRKLARVFYLMQEAHHRAEPEAVEHPDIESAIIKARCYVGTVLR